jgi:hypothetical protein
LKKNSGIMPEKPIINNLFMCFDLISGLKNLDYNLSLADMPICEASLEQSTTMDAHGAGLFQLPISFRPMDFGEALWDIVCGRGTAYIMTGKIQVETPFGLMHLPFHKSSETKLKKQSDNDDVCFSSFPIFFLGSCFYLLGLIHDFQLSLLAHLWLSKWIWRIPLRKLAQWPFNQIEMS